MKNIVILTCLCFTLNSCNGQIKSDSSRSSGIPIRDISVAANVPGLEPIVEDPYFVVTKDIVSEYGPNSITRNILQDKKGVFWFATWQGIMSYDGKQFVNHTLKNGLRRFHTFSVLEDSAGNRWFGSIGGGLYKYDGRTFTNYTTEDGLANNDVLCMTEDKNGNVWIGTDDGVSRYDGKTFTNFTTLDGLGGHSVNSIIQDKNGILWFGSRYGVVSDVTQYDGKSFTLFSNMIGTPFSNVRSILEDKNGDIWIGGQTGLFRYNGQAITPVSPKFIGYIFEDKSGTIWLSHGVEKGMALSRLDGIEMKLITVDDQVFGINSDTAGNIWFGTMYGPKLFNPSKALKSDGSSITDFLEDSQKQ
ncbi:MAG TPA: two-component regulator propeller domain-containing protein [Saprospiraceae bacterium]|nr:two-component regulator propeller domain-containing protein [Saprospiraceae bacterium]